MEARLLNVGRETQRLVGLRVLVVDDEPGIRRHVVAGLIDSGLDVVGEAPDGRTAVFLATATQPDVILLDRGLHDLPGREIIHELRERAPDAKVVVFCGDEEDGNAHTLRATFDGVIDGVFEKSDGVAKILSTIREVVSPRWPRARIALRADQHSPRKARDFVRATCREWHCESVVDTALLVVSELVTNAVLHARTGSELRLTKIGASLLIGVSDAGGGSPAVFDAGSDDEHGRGLVLISALSTAWGVDGDEDRKTIWAQVPIPGIGPHEDAVDA